MTSRVYVTETKPETVIHDYASLLAKLLPKAKSQPTILKLNLSWTKFYPACSSPPWQVEGVIKGMLDLGFRSTDIIPVENRTVVTNVYQGSHNHFWDRICRRYHVKMRYLPDEKYVVYRPKSKMLILDKIFPDGILLPQILAGKPLVSLCTLKTHVFTQTTGSIKNYFGMLNTKRHWAHRFIHETIIDLLQIQKELHPQIAAVMDGVVVGYGAGPRAMEWQEADLVLGSADEVALDAVAAAIIGLDPAKIRYLRLGKKLRLGENDLAKIKIVGMKKIPNFHLNKDETLASRGQNLIYHHLPWWLEKLLLHTFITPWSYLASRTYYDGFWYNFIGRRRIAQFMKSKWGDKLRQYRHF